MNPVGHPAEAVPLQGRYDGPPGQPGGATVVQCTTVDVISEPPKDHIIWSLCSFVYSNVFCLGLAALIYSVKSRDRKMAGDLEGAKRHGSTARSLNILSAILGAIVIFIFIFAIFRESANAHSYSYRY